MFVKKVVNEFNSLDSYSEFKQTDYICPPNNSWDKLFEMNSFCRLKELYKLVHELESEVHSIHQLSVNECMTMCSISRGFRSAGELAKECSQSKSRMSAVLAALEKKKLIQRKFDDIDKRKTLFVLTSLGKEKVIELESTAFEVPEIVIKAKTANSSEPKKTGLKKI